VQIPMAPLLDAGRETSDRWRGMTRNHTEVLLAVGRRAVGQSLLFDDTVLCSGIQGPLVAKFGHSRVYSSARDTPFPFLEQNGVVVAVFYTFWPRKLESNMPSSLVEDALAELMKDVGQSLGIPSTPVASRGGGLIPCNPSTGSPFRAADSVRIRLAALFAGLAHCGSLTCLLAR